MFTNSKHTCTCIVDSQVMGIMCGPSEGRGFWKNSNMTTAMMAPCVQSN